MRDARFGARRVRRGHVENDVFDVAGGVELLEAIGEAFDTVL
jgi:hypothetical protein